MFEYSLRLHIPPNVDFNERITNALDFCDKAKIDDVIFFINAEDLFTGHVTLDEAKSYVKIIAKAKERLDKKGITVSLNPWTTLGHYDGGRKLKQGQNFNTMVGHRGEKAEIVACPLCKNWRDYYVEILSYLISEVKPKTLWFEDDFRLSNHETLSGIISLGCFCDEHMKLYNQKLGTNYDRQTFVSKLGTDYDVRSAYLDISRETIEETLKYITDRLDKSCRFGLMTSGQAFEHGRRFPRLFEILGDSRPKPLNRQALGCYRQISGQQYVQNVNRMSFMVRALTGDSANCVAEIENSPHGNYVKSVNFDRFQMVACVPLLFSGATFSIFDFTGNGAIEYERLAKTYGKIKPYLSTVADLNLLPTDAQGVKVIIDQDVAYKAKTNKDYSLGLGDVGSYVFAYLQMLGISCSYTLDDSICGEVIALSGEVIRSKPKSVIERLFNENTVILTGDALLALFDVKLNHLISASSYKLMPECADEQTHEEWAGDEKICGISKMRGTGRYFTGDYVNLSFDDTAKIETLTVTNNYYAKPIGHAIARVNNAIIIPYTKASEIPYSLFCTLRSYAIKKAVADSKSKKPYYFVSEPNVSVYSYFKNGKTYLMFLNFSDDDYDGITLTTNANLNAKKLISEEYPNGTKPKVQKINEGYKIKQTVRGLSSYVLICE